MLESIDAARDRAAQPEGRRPRRQRARHPGRRRRRRSAPARRSSSRPSCRCAAIPRKTCCCARRSSTRARRELAALAGTVTRSTVARRLSRTRAARAATTPSPSCATAASRRSTARATCRTTRCSTRSATSSRARDPCVFDVDGVRFGVIICEDVWFPEPAARAKTAGAQVLLVPNGSPYHTRQHGLRARAGRRADARDRTAGRLRESRRRPGRAGVRRRIVRRRRDRARSRSRFPRGTRRWRWSHFDGAAPRHVRGALDPALEPHVYDALVMGVRDYVGKNRFPGVLLGLSGGVDSALTLAVAVDALGPRPRARGDAAVAVQRADQPRGRARDGGDRRRPLRRDPDRAGVFGVPRDARAGVPRPAARRHRGEHPGAHPRHAADGAVEQVRVDRAHDRQQVGDGGRLRDAVRRHGGRLRGAEGHPARRSSTGSATTATGSAA